MHEPAIDTHDMIASFGKFRGERFTRLPISYLRGLINDNHSKSDIARAELHRRGIPLADSAFEISGHAIDSASLRVIRIWRKDRENNEGLHAWLRRICMEAVEACEPDSDDDVIYKGMRLFLRKGEIYWVLKTIARDKPR